MPALSVAHESLDEKPPGGQVHGIPIAAAACVRWRKSGRTAIQSGPFPRPRQLSDPVRGRLTGGPWRRGGCGHPDSGFRLPGSGPGGDQRLACHEPALPGSQGRRPALPVTGPPAQEARDRLAGHLPGRMRRRTPGVPRRRPPRRAGMAGQGWPACRDRANRDGPAACASARHAVGHPRFSAARRIARPAARRGRA